MALISTTEQPAALVIRIQCSRFDYMSTSQIHREVLDAGLAHPDHPIVFDLAEVELVNSTGMSMFVGLKQYMDKHNRAMALAALCPKVLASFQKAQLHMLLEICETCEGALGKLQTSAAAS